MYCSRRNFLGGMASLGALAASPVLAAAAGDRQGALMRMGVLSDVHLKNPGDEDTLLKALAYFRDHGADSVLIAGDFADNGKICQAKMLADAWFKVFPDDRAPDGRHVERLFIYGNHCVSDWAWNGGFKNPQAATEAIGYGENRQRVWRELFHEDYAPIWMKRVKGIPVIGAHWKDDGGTDIEDFLQRHGKEIDPKLPFVYTQHAHPRNTCFGAWAWGHDDGRSTRALSPFANAVAFSGHSHYTLTDERSVWQGEFTSINTSSLRYASTDYSLRENHGGNGSGFGGERRPHRMKGFDTGTGRQGMLVSYFADHLVIERREFVYGESLGPDWLVPLPAAGKFSYAVRAAKRKAPEFADGAKVEVEMVQPAAKDDFTHIVLKFPAAHTVEDCRVSEYEATAILCEDDVELVQAQRRMMSPDHFLPAGKLIDQTSFTFAAEDLPMKGRYRFEVRPVECMGKKGRAISSGVVRI